MKKIKANSVYNFLNKIFPIESMADWDKSGLQIPDVFNLESQYEITGIVTCLDVNLDVVEFAIEKKCNLIISRHPFIFFDFEDEMKNPAKFSLYKKIVENEIQIYSIHSNYDVSKNQSLEKIIVDNFEIKKITRDFSDNSLITFELKDEQLAKDVIINFKKIFNIDFISTNFDVGNSKINNFILSQGASGISMVTHSIQNTVFVTGEAKWSEFLYANENKIKLIVLGHYMENYFIYDLKDKIDGELNQEIDCYSFDVKNMVKTY